MSIVDPDSALGKADLYWHENLPRAYGWAGAGTGCTLLPYARGCAKDFL